MGYLGASRLYNESHFGAVPSIFSYDDVNCNGYEMYLNDCSHKTSDNCGSTEGAGVECDNSNVHIGN